MNTSQNKILIVEFGEVKFVPAVLLLKTGLKPTSRQLERHPVIITRHDVFAGELKILRAGFGRSEFVRIACPNLPATPATFAEEQRKTSGL